MKVIDPQRTTWRVSRRWVPWRRKVRGWSDVWGLVPDLPGGDDPITGTISLILLILCAPIIALAVVLTLVAAVEFLAILALIPLLVLARVIFGRRWVVEVRRGFTPWYEQAVGDWSASRTAIETFADAIRRGQLPPHTLGAETATEGTTAP